MTTIDLAAIKAKAEAATPGPWFQTILPWFRANDGVLAGSADGNIGYLIVDCDTSFSCGERGDYEGPFKLSSPESDAAYIAAMDPPTALALIARIETAEAERGEAREKAWAEFPSGSSPTPASDSEWLPIESAPKGYPSLEEPSEWFIAIGKNSGPKGAGFAIIRRVFGHGFGPWEGTGDEYYCADFFTHWQPLPTAPVEKE